MNKSSRGQHPLPRYTIAEFTTKKHFLNVHEAIEINKLLIEVIEYDTNARRRTKTTQAYVDIPDCRLIAHMILNHQYAPGWGLEYFGGSERDGKIESRRFKIAYDLGPNNSFSRFPFRITISMGPGRKTSTGGFEPLSKQDIAQARSQNRPLVDEVECSIRLPERECMKVMLELQAYLSANTHLIQTLRYREQLLDWEQRGGTLTNEQRVTYVAAPKAGMVRLPAPLPRPNGQGTYPTGTRLNELDDETLTRIATHANDPYLREQAAILLGTAG